MLSNVLAGKRFYGWIALAGAMVVYFTCWGPISSYGVFFPRMVEDLGWSRAVVALPASLAGEIGAILGPLVGLSVVRFGARKNIILGTIALATGVALMFYINSVWQLILFWGILAHLGIGFSFFIPTTTIVNSWFVRRRSLALGILTASGGTGGFLFPSLMAGLGANIGWRWSWVVLGGIVLLVGTFFGGLLLIRNKPEDMGQLPDGEVAISSAEATSSTPRQSKVYQTPVDWKTRDAMKTAAFWLIVVCQTTNLFAWSTMSVHQVAHLEDLGVSSTVAASTLGLVLGMSIVGRLGVGVLSSRFEIRRLVTVCFTMTIIAILVLMNTKVLPLIYLYTLLFGIGFGGLAISTPIMTGNYFGRTNYSQLLGWVMPISAVFSATAPLIAGYIRDVSGSYKLAFIIPISLATAGLVCTLFIRPPKLPPSMSAL